MRARASHRAPRFPCLMVLVAAAAMILWSPVRGQEQKNVVVTFFWGEGCPHCEREKAFLAEIRKRYPGMIIKDYEVWHNRENAALYREVLRAAGFKQVGVPGTVVGSSVFLGFTDQTKRAVEQAIGRCAREGCPDGAAVISSRSPAMPDGAQNNVNLPLLGSVDPAKVSLPLFTVVIAGLDSFNPCAFFVLLFLLSLLIHARSRQRMLLIGGIFVVSSGVIYFLFMAAWLNLFLVIGHLALITMIGGIVALFVGGINVKDFFLFKKGVSLVIPESAKPKLFERMRGLLKTPSLPAMTAGAVVLAVSANAYELLCTAGFPMVYTRVLTLSQLTTPHYYQYLVLYNVVYVVPLAVIVAVVTITLGARKLTEWQGRVLKLVSGLMMLTLGGILIVDPALLNNVLASVVMLAGVVLASLIIIIITKKARPEVVRQS